MDCGICTSKTILLFLSLVFWGAGAALAYVGAYIIMSYKTFDSFVEDKQSLIPAGIIIITSVVMVVIGLVGCCSTLRESKFGLGCFFLVIVIVFAAEVTALAFIFIYQSKSAQINQELQRSMNETFTKYGDSLDTKAVDDLQSQLKCCGVVNYTSWHNTPWYQKNKTIPQSCCINKTQCDGTTASQFYQEGCVVKVEKFLHDVLNYAMLVILGFAIIKFFGMLSVCVITCRSSRRSGYEPLYA
ncbi:PREDICTED: tetraspanin-3-like [Poecilia mexicana]|uniref:Tetraspanin n=1 Tax=Poecilia mexicana TaxID=48701 RepID=A0A3B3WXQ6_9TELE|nr:PREDICTED: tetraspanin-3-like [Poecilia mexicana]